MKAFRERKEEASIRGNRLLVQDKEYTLEQLEDTFEFDDEKPDNINPSAESDDLEQELTEAGSSKEDQGRALPTGADIAVIDKNIEVLKSGNNSTRNKRPLTRGHVKNKDQKSLMKKGGKTKLSKK